MKRRLKQFGLMLAGVLVLFVGYLAVEHVRGTLALNHRLKEWSAAGEQLSVEPLRPRPVPAAQNAAIEFYALTNFFKSHFTNFDNAPPSLRFAAPGKAVVSWRLNEWPVDRKRTNNWANVGAELATATEILRIIHSAARKPALDTDFPYQNGFLDFQIGPFLTIKRSMQVMNLATQFELHNGHRDAAYEHLVDQLGLVSQQSEPLVICQLVRHACAALAFNATWEALQSANWTDEQLTELQNGWARIEFTKDMARSFEMERAMTLAHYDLLKNDGEKRWRLVQQNEDMLRAFGQSTAGDFVPHWIKIPVWRVAWADQDALRALARWEAITSHERFARSNGWTALNAHAAEETEMWWPIFQEPEQRSWWDRFRFPFSSVSFGISDTLIRRTLSMQTQKRMTVTAIVLKRFQLRTGRLPDDLSALVPVYMHELPRDDMDGGVLRYRRVTDAEFVLYSVGSNGKDEGGDAMPQSDKTSHQQIWDGRDAVWPTAATVGETATAMRTWPTKP